MPPTGAPETPATAGFARLMLRIVGRLLPHAEREEVLADLASEHARRQQRAGVTRASLWLAQQALGSLPTLLRRSVWRGATGFEPPSSRLRSGGPGFEGWIIDARYSFRRLLARPVYAGLAVLTLALGVGGTAAVFSVVRALFLDPLPVAREHEVAVFWQAGNWNEAEFLHLRETGLPGFREVAAVRPLDATLAVHGQPLRLVEGVGATAELFGVLDAQARLGRTFHRGDDLPGAEPVVVVSHRLWRELGGRPEILGSRLRLGGIDRTVIGVMPPGFWYPNPTVQVWTTMRLSPENTAGNYALVGRLAPGLTMEQMGGPLAAIASSLRERFRYPSAWDKSRDPSVTPLREHLVGDLRPGVLATLWATGILLVIACVNVSALMLGQVGGRLSELAVRTALGAGRGRLSQQLVFEALIIGLLAAVVGAVFAVAGFRLLVRSLPLGALADVARLDWTLFGAALAASVVAAVAVAAAPGWAMWRMDLHGVMVGERTSGPTVRGGRLEAALVVGQVALAVLVVAGAGLLLRSVQNLRRLDPGVRTAGVALVDGIMPTELAQAERQRTILAMLEHLRAVPNVRHVAAIQTLPLRGRSDSWGLDVEGKPEFQDVPSYFRVVSREYMNAMGMRVTRGRGFETSDRPDTERVVLINEALAARYFAEEDPVGRVLHTGFDDRGERVIGVVNDVTEGELTDGVEPARYMLYDQVPLLGHWATFVLSGVPPRLLPATLHDARRVVAASGLPVAVNETTTMTHVFDRAMGPAAQLVSLVAAIALVALVLGAVGVYGMISHHVTRRMRDDGIRIALGMEPSRLSGRILVRGVTLVAIGGVVGVVAALLLTRLAESLLFGVPAHDPLTLATAAASLVVVGVGASLMPARRAGRSDPAQLLRQP
jgi:predicted permease